MAVFKIETKNKFEINKKTRVYFTCHPDDFDKYFKKVCNDIFKTHDCAIYYTEDMTETIADEDKETDLGRSNLFVIPVTYKLLTTSNRAVDEDLPYALQKHIPILPIMMEAGIDGFYSKPEKFGELQYLSSYSNDCTEISYEEKLKKYLESVLISDEMATRIRMAFGAYIFLSYRKKDRKYANELMRLIHSNPECRDIAIWFDEFLTPGESFKDNIEKIIDNCELFTLLVTPQLMKKVVDENGEERDNYIISTELPLARKKKEEKGIDIFAVEMEHTDREDLFAIQIEDYVKSTDSTFRSRLLDVISQIDITTNNTPEHNFLIGLAYLKGIDVEVNYDLALELITSAANKQLPEAMKKLSYMYQWGIGVPLNYSKAVFWCKKVVDYNIEMYGEENAETLKSMNALQGLYDSNGEYEKALELCKKIYEFKCKIWGDEHPDSLEALRVYALGCWQSGYQKKALELREKCYALFCKVYGEEHNNTVMLLSDIGLSKGELGEHSVALKLHQKAYEASCKKCGEEALQTLVILQNVATEYYYLKDYGLSIELYEKVYSSYCKALGEEHPYSLYILRNLSMPYEEQGDYKKSLELREKAYFGLCKSLGMEHPHTLMFLAELPYSYYQTENSGKYIQYANEMYNTFARVYGEKDKETVKQYNYLAVAYGKSGKYLKALEILLKAYKIHIEVFGKIAPETTLVLENIASICKKIHLKLMASIIYKVVKKRKSQYNIMRLFGKK